MPPSTNTTKAAVAAHGSATNNKNTTTNKAGTRESVMILGQFTEWCARAGRAANRLASPARTEEFKQAIPPNASPFGNTTYSA